MISRTKAEGRVEILGKTAQESEELPRLSATDTLKATTILLPKIIKDVQVLRRRSSICVFFAALKRYRRSICSQVYQ